MIYLALIGAGIMYAVSMTLLLIGIVCEIREAEKRLEKYIKVDAVVRRYSDFRKLLRLFKETSFKEYPVEIKHVPGKDNDTLQDDYPESRMYYREATRHFADWGKWANAVFVKEIIEYFIKISD